MTRKVGAGLTHDYRFYLDGANLGEFSLFSPSDIVNVVELRGFEIYPAYRGKGYSYKMLAEVVSLAKVYNFPILSLKVKSDNAPAIKLYVNSGFVVRRVDTERGEQVMELDV